jgi:hypothetical protein
MDLMFDELSAAVKKVREMSFQRSGGNRPEPPIPLVEPNDMEMVASPCHGFEPVKVREDWTEPLHSLVCGAAFRL